MSTPVFSTAETETPASARAHLLGTLSPASTATDALIVLWRLRQIGREA